MKSSWTAGALAALISLSVSTEGLGWSLDPLRDPGLAAVEVKTGKVLWEAWALDEVPKDHRLQALRVMRPWWDPRDQGNGKGDPGLQFRTMDSNGRFYVFLEEKGTRQLEIDNAVFAVFEDVATGSIGNAMKPFSESHYFVLSGEKLHGLLKQLPEPGQEWKPEWSLDLGWTDSKKGTRVIADAGLVWLIGPRRIVAVSSAGEKLWDRTLEAEVDPFGDITGDPPEIRFFDDRAAIVLDGKFQVFDRFNAKIQWSAPLERPERFDPNWMLIPVPEKEVILLHESVPGEALEAEIVALEWDSGDMAWRAAEAAEAPEDFRSFVEKAFTTQPGFEPRRWEPNNFFERVGVPDSFSLPDEDSEREVWNWQATAEHVFTFSEDLVVRCYDRNMQAGEARTAKWKFDLGYDGAKLIPERGQLWVVGKGRVVCLSDEGEIVKDFSAPASLAFERGYNNAAQTAVRLDPDALFLASYEVTALDRETGGEMWRFNPGLDSHYEIRDIDVERSPDGDTAYLVIRSSRPYPVAVLLGDDSAHGWEQPGLDPPPVTDSAARSEWAVFVAEMARAFGDGLVHRKLKDGAFNREGLTEESIARIEAIARSEWPTSRSKPGLIAFCRQKFSEIPPESGDDVDAADFRVQLWSMLYQTPGPTDLESIDALTDLSVRALRDGSESERSMAAMVWAQQCSRSERIDAELVEELFIEKNPGFSEVAVSWHTDRGNVERAAEILLQIDESKRGEYWGTAFLVNRQQASESPGPHETAFLVTRFETMPADTVRYTVKRFRENPDAIPKPFVEALRNRVQREAENPQATPRNAGGLTFRQRPSFTPEFLELLGLAGKPDDTPLFRRFLDHPEYRDNHVRNRRDKETKKAMQEMERDYIVRNAAAKILKERGEAIPASVVLAEKFEREHPSTKSP